MDVEKMLPEEKAKLRDQIDEQRRAIVFDRDSALEGDIVLAKMLEVGAPLTLAAYIEFAYFGTAPEGIEQDAEFLSQVPDVIRSNSRFIQ
jgi:hypothetical protein